MTDEEFLDYFAEMFNPANSRLSFDNPLEAVKYFDSKIVPLLVSRPHLQPELMTRVMKIAEEYTKKKRDAMSEVIDAAEKLAGELSVNENVEKNMFRVVKEAERKVTSSKRRNKSLKKVTKRIEKVSEEIN